MLYHYFYCGDWCNFLGGFGEGLGEFGHGLRLDYILDYNQEWNFDYDAKTGDAA